MKEAVQKAIEDITFVTKKFPKEAFRIISENQELAVPYLNSAIEKAIGEADDLDEDYQLHFYALFLLAQFQEKQSFPLIMEMVSLPGEALDYLIGDTITTDLGDILYNTYNGDPELMEKAVMNPNIDDFARGSVLKAMGQLCLDGDIEKERFQEFIRQIVYEREEIGEYVYTDLAYVICRCHFVEMLPEIRRLYADRRVDESSIGGYDGCIDILFKYRRNLCKKPIDAAETLRGWSMFEEESPKSGSSKNSSKKDVDKLFQAMDPFFSKPEKKVKIGRNDPCPCGSGKKYKKCCMNKPKQEVEEEDGMIESRQEQKRWLKDYPESADERKEGRIYLEDFYDAESIETDKLLYLALNQRPFLIWSREPEEVVHKRKLAYLSEAFSKFSERVEREQISTFQEYDEKYSIHYPCGEWIGTLRELLRENGDRKLGRKVSECCKKMKG